MKKNIQNMIDLFQNEIFQIHQYLHKNPELSGQEYNTSNFIRQYLQKENIRIIDFNMETGVIGLLETNHPGKTLMLRADIDALPLTENTGLPFTSNNIGVSHSCGHDIHMTILLTVAHILNKIRKDLNGKIIFLFQPSEENLSGAKNLIEKGLLEYLKPDIIIGHHTWPNLESGKIGLIKKEFMASSDIFTININGKGGHGAHPEECVDPILISCYLINALQSIISRNVDPLESAVLTIGQLNSGTAPNIIPNSVTLRGTIRTLNKGTREKIIDKISTISCEVSKAMGGTAKIIIEKGTPCLENSPQIVEWIENSAKKILGDENIMYLPKPSMGSEDFAEYLQYIPGAMFRIGTCNTDPKSKLSLHNPSLIFDEKSILTGAKTIAQFSFDYLNNNYSFST